MAAKTVTTKSGSHGTTPINPDLRHKVWMQILVSIIMLIAGLLILASPNFIIPGEVDEATKRYASGWIGAIIGYWLS